jgi:hypothetical protein
MPLGWVCCVVGVGSSSVSTDSEGSGRKCIFCGEKADSYEHVFGDWINQVFRVEEIEARRFFFSAGTMEELRSHTVKRAAAQRAKVVCKRCNTGWMSDLEGEASRLLPPLIAGKSVTLDPKEQVLAATWAIKTAMVGEFIQRQPPSFSAEDRRLMRAQQHLPIRAATAIAAYDMGEQFATRYMRGLGTVEQRGAPFMDLYVHTIQVGHLVLSIRGTTTLPASDNRSLERIAEPHYLEIPVFPPVEKCRWPPTVVMDERTLLEYSGLNNLDRRY